MIRALVAPNPPSALMVSTCSARLETNWRDNALRASGRLRRRTRMCPEWGAGCCRTLRGGLTCVDNFCVWDRKVAPIIRRCSLDPMHCGISSSKDAGGPSWVIVATQVEQELVVASVALARDTELSVANNQSVTWQSAACGEIQTISVSFNIYPTGLCSCHTVVPISQHGGHACRKNI